MSITLWREFPEGFLRMGFTAWNKLGHDVKELIVEIARNQEFKCALCNTNRALVVEHDHEPEEGPGKRPTVYNIRGLTCTRCNNDLSVYERQERGEYFGLDNVTPCHSDSEYVDYFYNYDCRVSPLLEAAHECRVGCANVWYRRLILQKFDDWYYEGGTPPSSLLQFREIEKRKIRTPEKAIEVFVACTQYVVDELEKDPNFQPPDDFLRLMVRMRPIIEQARAIREAGRGD